MWFGTLCDTPVIDATARCHVAPLVSSLISQNVEPRPAAGLVTDMDIGDDHCRPRRNCCTRLFKKSRRNGHMLSQFLYVRRGGAAETRCRKPFSSPVRAEFIQG